MQKSLTLILSLFALFAQPAWAQVKGAVILPVEMPGYYNPTDSEILAQDLAENLAGEVRNTDLHLATNAELTIYQYQPGSQRPPSLSEAAKMAEGYDTNYVVWLSTRFLPEYDDVRGTLSVSAGARLWVYSYESQDVVVDTPFSVVEFADWDKIEDREATRERGIDLALDCMQRLAFYIAKLGKTHRDAREARVKAWSKSGATPVRKTPKSENVDSAAQKYVKAVDSGNPVDVTQAETALGQVWKELPSEQQSELEKSYPGIADMMKLDKRGYDSPALLHNYW